MSVSGIGQGVSVWFVWEPSLKRLFLPLAETFQIGCFIAWPVLHAAFRSGGTVVLGGSWRYLQTHLAIAVTGFASFQIPIEVRSRICLL